jgi:hypothetical protein
MATITRQQIRKYIMLPWHVQRGIMNNMALGNEVSYDLPIHEQTMAFFAFVKERMMVERLCYEIDQIEVED